MKKIVREYLPTTVKSFGNESFDSCNIRQIDIHTSVTYIGEKDTSSKKTNFIFFLE